MGALTNTVRTPTDKFVWGIYSYTYMSQAQPAPPPQAMIMVPGWSRSPPCGVEWVSDDSLPGHTQAYVQGCGTYENHMTVSN